MPSDIKTIKAALPDIVKAAFRMKLECERGDACEESLVLETLVADHGFDDLSQDLQERIHGLILKQVGSLRARLLLFVSEA